MSNVIVQYSSKITKLLETLLRPNVEVKNADQLEILLKHLEANKSSDNCGSLIDLPVFLEWLMQTVPVWSLNKDHIPSNHVTAFTMNVTSLLTVNEIKFCALNNNNFYVKLVKISKARNAEAPATVKLAYIKLLSSFLDNPSGIEWMVGSNSWEDILEFSLYCDNLLVVKAARRFMSKILDKVIDHDSEFCNKVVKKIMFPLGENTSKTINFKTADNCDKLLSTLQLLGFLLEYFLENSLLVKQDSRVVEIFSKNFELEQRVSDLMLVSQNKYIVFDLGRIMLIMKFLQLHFTMVSGHLTVEHIQQFADKVLNIFMIKLSAGNYDHVMKFCCFGQLYWKLIDGQIPIVLVNHKKEFEDFAVVMTTFLLLPVCISTLKHSVEDRIRHLQKDEIRDVYIQNILKSLNYGAIRRIMTWKRVLVERPDLFEIASKSLVHILKHRKLYSREHAVVIVQTLIYGLEDLVVSLKQEPHRYDVFIPGETSFALKLDALSILIQEFQINWRESVETMDLMSITYEFLTIPRWPPILVVKALNLLHMTLKYYMSPNLALLVDRTSDSTTGVLGSLLDAKLQECWWETRKAALETLVTLTSLSNNKFPSLQKVLMDSDLPGLVVKMATQDGESFVRATAIKCLQEMIQVEEIWNNALQSQDLSEKMRQILINETEGIVRVEAATFMCISYENNHFPDDSLEKVYETMIHSSTTDLHWEVKVRALSFWDKVIHNHLQHQGMIDGSFPSVTFSKEHRKIVTLTDAEIKKRLQKILGQLSCIGCLGVLISAIRDDCDMEVSKTAVKITQKLVELLKKYSINADSTVPISPQPTENGMSSSASISSGISGDDFMGSPATNANTELNEEIIDQIVNSRDVNLLQNVYTPSDYGSVLNYDVQVRKIVSPNEFLLFTQQDLNAIINEKKNWLNGIEDLGSLLDDMLKTYDDDVNSMDCY